MDVFVTGGTGTIGSAIIKQLVFNGLDTIALARSDAASETLRAAGASAYPGDLRKPESWVERAASCDAVIHTGATFSEDMGRVDRQSMLALKNAAKHRKQPLKVVYTGGIWLYPPTRDKFSITEKTSFSPLPAFRFMTETIRTLSNGTDLNLVVIHPALVCSRTTGPVAELTRALKAGMPFETRASTDTSWPLVESHDLAALYVQALKQSRFRMSMIACGLPGTTVGKLASHISARHGRPLEITTRSAPSDADPDKDWAAGYALSQQADSTHARRTTGWDPEFSTVEDFVVGLSK